MLKRLHVVTFSPTGGTRRAALCLGRALAEELVEVDLSLPRAEEHRFGPEDVAVLAAPVYGGRIPALQAQRLKGCRGGGAAAVTAVVYGNRAFEDALVELNDCAQAQGFRVMASLALVAEHSLVRAVAAGRPDGDDEAWLRARAPELLDRLARGGTAPAVPGERPYKEWKPMPATPAVSDACVGCGLCAQRCPAGAIPGEDPRTTDPARCVLCARCIALCPTGARALPAPVRGMLEQKLSPLAGLRRENELFL